MICSVRTLGISGIRGSGVVAECYISNGLPGFDIVGLPDAAVKEARERVRAASKSSGLSFPVSRITVNLAPANLKKVGTHYDLPILLSILAASGEIRRPKSTSAFLGEVSLDGKIRPISGVLPMALAAKREGIKPATSVSTMLMHTKITPLTGGSAAMLLTSERCAMMALTGMHSSTVSRIGSNFFMVISPNPARRR